MVRKNLITKMEKAQTRKDVNKLVHTETFQMSCSAKDATNKIQR